MDIYMSLKKFIPRSLQNMYLLLNREKVKSKTDTP